MTAQEELMHGVLEMNAAGYWVDGKVKRPLWVKSEFAMPLREFDPQRWWLEPVTGEQ